MQIEWARLERIANDAFENCGRLERFEGDDNPEFSELPTVPVFRNCQHLRILSFMNCNLSSIPANFLEGLTNLEILRFTGNKIVTIDPNLLAQTPNIRSLSFAANPLNEIPSSLFRGLSQLEILELFDTNIKVINQLWFTNLNNLRTLSLSSNQISHIQLNIFTNLQRLEVLFLASNQLARLNTFGRLPNLIHLDVNNNQMTAIEPTFFNNLPVLDIFEAQENLCVNQRVENVSGINFELNPVFNQCFGNWNEPLTTTTTTTLAPTTTTTVSAGSQISLVGLMTFALIISSKFLI
jgi:Leucine-rich repeat (LRR) protein